MGAGQRAAVAVAVEVAIAAVAPNRTTTATLQIADSEENCCSKIRRSVQDVLIPEAEEGSK